MLTMFAPVWDPLLNNLSWVVYVFRGCGLHAQSSSVSGSGNSSSSRTTAITSFSNNSNSSVAPSSSSVGFSAWSSAAAVVAAAAHLKLTPRAMARQPERFEPDDLDRYDLVGNSCAIVPH